MNQHLFSTDGRGAKLFLFPLLVLFTGVALTIFASYFASRAVRFENETVFQNNVQDIENSIQTRMDSYTALLRSGAGLLTTTADITRTQFQSFIEPLRIPTKYPGLTEIGVAPRVPPSNRAPFADRMRSQGMPNFHIWPEPGDEDSFPVIAVEPEGTNRLEIVGFDLLSDPVRQQAMEQAAQMGDVAASGKVLLKNEKEQATHAGFLVFMPFYSPVQNAGSTAQRSARIRGFLYAAFRAEDFFRVLLDSPLERGLRFLVYDETGTNTQQLLYRSSAAAPPAPKVFNNPYHSESHVIVAGHRWTLHAWLRPNYIGNWFAAPAILVFGALMSFILAYHTLSRAQSQHRAELNTTELRGSEQALRESQEHLRLMIESASDYAIFSLDTQGVVTSWNSGAQRLFQYPDKEIIGRSGEVLFTPEDRARGEVEKELAIAGREGAAQDERWHLRKDGTRFFASGMVRPIHDPSGKMRGYIKVARDFTEQRKGEQSLREAQETLRSYATQLENKVAERTAKLEESLEAMAGVMYHVAHDLRAPLRAMSSFTEILLSDYLASLDSSGKDYLERISEASKRMDELVNALLAYGRLTHTLIVLEDLNVEQTVQELSGEFAEELKKRSARLEIRSPLPSVRANGEVLKDVFRHLLSNALLFARDDEPSRITIWGEEGKNVRLWVEDNGIGIDRPYLERIFKMFERLNPQEKYPGTGMGLALVRKAMDRLGGRVGVESEPGVGSRFWLELAPAIQQIAGFPRREDTGTAG